MLVLRDTVSVTLLDPESTLRELQSIAVDPNAPPERRASADAVAGVLRALAMTANHSVANLLSAGWQAGNRWGGTANADVRADVRGTGRDDLVEALDELTRRCAP